MRVELAYGSARLPVELPDGRTTVITPSHPQAAKDERAEVFSALRRPVAGPPLRDVAKRGGTVAISICDGTRPQPRDVVVPALLEELDGLVRVEDVVLLVATGTHRGNTDDELRAMLGDEVFESVRVVNHNARDDASLTWIGRLGVNADVPVWLCSEWLEADIRITTGFVEPHFFAGFSGGPKLIAPGLAGLETTLTLHDARRIGHPAARWGITEGNPIHDDVRAIAAATGADFALDVILDEDKRIVRAFGGELLAMHRSACVDVREIAMRAVDGEFDVVVTSNSGYPLDQNLYQAVKGMSAAAEVVKLGGLIICAAECRDGFPSHGSFRDELTSASSPQALLAAIESREQTVPDQWEAQIQAKIQARARVVMQTSFLSDDELAGAHLEQTPDIAETVATALAAAGPDARVCALPEGPQTIPYVAA
ncbi:MAG: nickel-dependent lactate racemase [Gaiellaceae bacterium]